MSSNENISVDIELLEKNIEKIKQLNIELENALQNSGYVPTVSGKFQSENGNSALSSGRAVHSVSYIDNNAYFSLKKWQKTTENTIGFLNKSVDLLKEADGQI